MRRFLPYALCMIFVLLNISSLWAKAKYTVAILPFSVYSVDNLDYMKHGIEEMLSSRLTGSDKIIVVHRNVVREAMRNFKTEEITDDEAFAIGKKLGSDYVVRGSITKIGNSVSIDTKLVDIEKTKSDISLVTQSQNLDDVIPKMNDFSQNVLQHILASSHQNTAVPGVISTPDAVTQKAPKPALRELQILSGMKSNDPKGATLTSVINSEFINTEEPLNRNDFWKSQKFFTELKGIDIGDVNNDKINEIVLIDRNNVYVYQKTDNGLILLEKITGHSYDHYLSVDVADINKNGVKEIIVTSLNDTLLNSFVLEFKDGKYEKIASNIRWFLRVIDTASGPLLLGQEYGFGKPFDTPAYELIWKNGKYTADQKIKIPQGLSIYGLTIADLGIGKGENIIALDDLDYLYITENTHKSIGRLSSFGSDKEEIIWKSDDVYGGSNNYLENIDRKNPEGTKKSAYVNLRILTFDTNKNGKQEIIIVKNLSSVGRIFKNFRLFTSSEIHNLEWNGVTMAENWRTKKINGYLADYCIKDIDNDGKSEIVLVLNLNVGLSLKGKSAIVVYKLDNEQ